MILGYAIGAVTLLVLAAAPVILVVDWVLERRRAWARAREVARLRRLVADALLKACDDGVAAD